MEVTSYIFVIPILILSLCVVKLLGSALHIDAPKHKYSSIDGLRGFLAMFVFLHHSSIWFYFARTGLWGQVLSGLFYHFGSTSVALFFMITSFLFFSKLMDGYGSQFDWLRLYVGRVMRIVPLYLVVIIGMFVVIGIITEFTLQETFRMLMIQFAQWVFIMDPDVNKLDRTRLLICGVQWSLAYEWMFYCALAPIGWIIFKLKQPMSVILFSVGFLIIFLLIIRNNYPGHFWWRLCPFGSGLIAAFIARNEKIRSYFLGWGSSIVILVLGLVSVFIFSSIFSFIPVICITFAFVGIACGNDLFGFLNWTICRQLGQISYSIYLVHGLILFIFFYFVLGFQQSSNFTPLGHWVIICICSIWTVALCCVTYRYIERPGIRAAMSVTSQIRSVLRSKGNSKVPIA